MALSFKITPFAEHVPDSGPDAEHKNPDSVEKGAGQLELGFYVGDHRIVFSSLKAGGFTDLFENGDPTTGKPASSAGATSTSSSEPATDERYAALEQRIAELEQREPASAETDTQPPAE